MGKRPGNEARNARSQANPTETKGENGTKKPGNAVSRAVSSGDVVFSILDSDLAVRFQTFGGL